MPTHYVRDGRGVREQRTRGIWRAGRIRNLVGNPVYAGTIPYGRRSTKRDRKIIRGPGRAIVDQATWDAARAVLAGNRLIPKNTRTAYLLRGRLTCSICHLTLVGTKGRAGTWWYRCGGKQRDRGPDDRRCPSQLIPGPWLERLSGRTSRPSYAIRARSSPSSMEPPSAPPRMRLPRPRH